MPIRAFLGGKSFDPETLAILNEAFQGACADLGVTAKAPPFPRERCQGSHEARRRPARPPTHSQSCSWLPEGAAVARREGSFLCPSVRSFRTSLSPRKR